MRVAALYDMHGNLPALRAVLEDVERAGVETIVVGGDVATGPLPRATIEELMALGPRARFVMGNADREIVDAFDAGTMTLDAHQSPAERAAAFAAGQIDRSQRDFLASFAPALSVEIDGLGATLFCHGSPRSDVEMITTATTERRLQDVLEGVPTDVVVCGHTHRQFDRTAGRRRVINAGSVGMPYEGRTGAYWALLGPEVELRRTHYDLDAALAELRGGGFPDLEEMLAESLLQPMDPDGVAEFFERQARAAGRSP